MPKFLKLFCLKITNHRKQPWRGPQELWPIAGAGSASSELLLTQPCPVLNVRASTPSQSVQSSILLFPHSNPPFCFHCCNFRFVLPSLCTAAPEHLQCCIYSPVAVLCDVPWGHLGVYPVAGVSLTQWVYETDPAALKPLCRAGEGQESSFPQGDPSCPFLLLVTETAGKKTKNPRTTFLVGAAGDHFLLGCDFNIHWLLHPT